MGGFNQLENTGIDISRFEEIINKDLSNLVVVSPSTYEEIADIVYQTNNKSRSYNQGDLKKIITDSSFDTKYVINQILMKNTQDGDLLLDEAKEYIDFIKGFHTTFTKLIKENNNYRGLIIMELYKNFDMIFKFDKQIISEALYSHDKKSSDEVKKIITDLKSLEIESENFKFDNSKIYTSLFNVSNNKNSKIITKILLNYKAKTFATLESRFDNANIEDSINKIEFYYLAYYTEKIVKRLNVLYKIKGNEDISLKLAEIKKENS